MKNTEKRSNDCMAYKIVVARYAEDLNWLDKYTPVLQIQNKGDLNTIPDKMKSCTRTIKNVGLEAHSYLEYIIENYDNLPEHILFIQGLIDDHKDCFDPYGSPLYKICDTRHRCTDNFTPENYIDSLVDQLLHHGRTLNAKVYVNAQGVPMVHKNIKLANIYALDDTGKMFGEWFEDNVLKSFPHPSKFQWFKNAIFGAHKAYILSRPKSFYINILNQLTSLTTEVGHYIERSWFYMLNMDTVHIESPHDPKHSQPNVE